MPVWIGILLGVAAIGAAVALWTATRPLGRAARPRVAGRDDAVTSTREPIREDLLDDAGPATIDWNFPLWVRPGAGRRPDGSPSDRG